MNKLRWPLLALTALLMQGCGDPTTDTRAWMTEVQARARPEIEPLPVLEPPEQFVYSREGLADPFVDRLQLEPPAASLAGSDSGLRPDSNRPRESLEAYPFDALRMVGTLARGKALWALIRAPDQTITRIAVGNYLGQSDGRVVSVTPDAVNVVELIATADGHYVERHAALALVEQR